MVLGSVEPNDVEVLLETAGGIVGVPESVVIPAGQIGGVFPIEGLQGGVASLNARIDESYETARSRIQVLADTTPLRLERLFPLEILFNDPRERLMTFPVGRRLPYGLLLLAFDDNDLPYANAPISVTASGDGFAESEQTHTDAFGSIVLNWTLATTPGANTLTVEVEGSARPPLVVEAVGTAPPTRSRNPKIFLFP